MEKERGRKEELKQKYHQKKEEANQRIMESYASEISNIIEGQGTEGINFCKFIDVKGSRHKKEAKKNKSGKITEDAEELMYIKKELFEKLYKKTTINKRGEGNGE